jgi:hypothetical protein
LVRAPINYLRGLEPTPSALRNGRLTLVIVAAVVGAILILLVLDPAFGDTGMLAITGATVVTLVGHVLSYVGQPTLGRYRLGLVVMAIGIVAAFWLVIANPFPRPG